MNEADLHNLHLNEDTNFNQYVFSMRHKSIDLQQQRQNSKEFLDKIQPWNDQYDGSLYATFRPKIVSEKTVKSTKPKMSIDPFIRKRSQHFNNKKVFMSKTQYNPPLAEKIAILKGQQINTISTTLYTPSNSMNKSQQYHQNHNIKLQFNKINNRSKSNNQLQKMLKMKQKLRRRNHYQVEKIKEFLDIAKQQHQLRQYKSTFRNNNINILNNAQLEEKEIISPTVIHMDKNNTLQIIQQFNSVKRNNNKMIKRHNKVSSITRILQQHQKQQQQHQHQKQKIETVLTSKNNKQKMSSKFRLTCNNLYS